MKNEIKIYNERKQINEEKMQLKRTINMLDEKILDLQNSCNHKIILAFDDHKPHKIVKIVKCFCPICGKIKNIYVKEQINESHFKNSKYIDLTDYPLSIFIEFLPFIAEYIINNFEKICKDINNETEVKNSIINLVNKWQKEKVNQKVLKRKKQKIY